MKVCGSQGRGGYITWQTDFNHISEMFRKVISAISPPWDFSMATRSHKTRSHYTSSCLLRLPSRPLPSPFSSLPWTLRSQTLLYCAKSKSSRDLSPRFLSVSTFLYPAPHHVVVVCLFVTEVHSAEAQAGLNSYPVPFMPGFTRFLKNQLYQEKGRDLKRHPPPKSVYVQGWGRCEIPSGTTEFFL